MLRPGRVGRDEWKIQVVFLGGREGDLRLLRLFLDALDRIWLLGKVDAGFLFEIPDDPIHEAVVPIVAAEVGVAVRGGNLEDPVADFEGRDVKRAAAKIIDRDFFVGLFVEPVGQRGGGWLVDDALHVESGDLAGILRRIALRVVEIGGDGDDGLGDFFTQLGFGIGLEFAENHR